MRAGWSVWRRYNRQPANYRHPAARQWQEELDQLAAAGSRRLWLNLPAGTPTGAPVSVPGVSSRRVAARRRKPATGGRRALHGLHRVTGSHGQHLDDGRHHGWSLHSSLPAGRGSTAHSTTGQGRRRLRHRAVDRLLSAAVFWLEDRQQAESG